MTQTSKKRLFSIRGTLLVPIFSICLIPLIIITTIFTRGINNSTHHQFINNADRFSDIGVSLVDTKISLYHQLLDSAIQHESFNNTQDPGYTQLRNTFKFIANTDDSIVNIYFASHNTDFVQFLDDELPEGFVVTESDWYKRVTSAPDKFDYEQPYFDTFTGDSVFTIYRAVKKNNQVLGVLAIDISLAELARQLESLQYGTDGNLIVTSSDGSIVSNIDHSLLATSEVTEYSKWDEISANDSGSLTYVHNDISYEAVYKTSQLTGWKFIFKIPASELSGAQKQSTLFSVIMIFIAALICSLIIFVLTRLLCKNIYQAVDFIDKAADGQFNSSIEFNSPIREFDRLFNNLNVMQHNISHILNEFNNSILHINEKTSSSLEESRQVAGSIEQITITMSDISQGTNESASNLEKINSNMEQLSNNMDAIKDTAENINQMASQTSKLGESGLATVHNVEAASSQTQQNAVAATQAIHEVSSKIEAISIMSSTIGTITEQTNLLALNAAIEAARAGEAGKGFAVVAEEIRKLAEETAASAQKINEVVLSIESFVEAAVDKVYETAKSISSQDEAIKDAQSIFSNIVQSVDDLSVQVTDITNELSSVNKMKNNVIEQVESLSSILEETAAGSEEISGSADSVKSASADFVSNLSKLSDLAKDLDEHITRFDF